MGSALAARFNKTVKECDHTKRLLQNLGAAWAPPFPSFHMEFGPLAIFTPVRDSSALAMSSLPLSSSSSPSALSSLPKTVISTSRSSNSWCSHSTKCEGCCPNSLTRCRSGRLTRTAGLGAGGNLDALGGVVPMRMPMRWWVWQYHGRAHAHGAQTLQDMSVGGCGRFVRGSRKLDSALLLHSALPFGSHQHLDFRVGQTRVLTCPDASSGRGGEAQVGSSEEVPNFGASLLRTVQEFRQLNWLGFRGFTKNAVREKVVDEGDWRYSPEWWGTQAGGWGHNAGETVFEAPSVMGNGVVSVTSHPASTPATIEYKSFKAGQRQSEQESESDSRELLSGHRVLGYEWRVLRFNSVTRQSVAKVKALATSVGDVISVQQPNCIAFEYVKSMISAGLSAVSLCGLDLQRVHTGYQKIRILCIGLGGGSLPLFLAQSLAGATVEVVEIDATVILAAVQTMGFPPTKGATKDQAIVWGDLLERIILHENDGEAFVCEQARNVLVKKAELEYDLVFVDAYDGEDVVPFKLWDRNGPFLSSLSSLLNADHGTVVVNLHTDSAPPSIIERISGKFGPGFDPTRPQGKRVQEAAFAYRDALLKQSYNGQAQVHNTRTNALGLAFTVAVSLQGNISLVVSRLASTKTEVHRAFTHQKTNTEEVLTQAFVKEADRVQRILNLSFDMPKRVQRGFQIVK